MDYDVIVVGAGPAGLATADFAVRSGISVLVLEKKREIGTPVRCAEGLGVHALNELDIDHPSFWTMNSVRAVKVYSPKGRMFKYNFPLKEHELYILDRARFERFLAERAVKGGAKILLRKNVTELLRENGKISGVRAGEEEFRGKIIVGADGIESRVGRMAGFDTTLNLREIAVGLQHTLENIELERECIELYIGKRYAPRGYAWVFPRSKNSANVGLCYAGNENCNGVKLLNSFISFRAKESKSIRFTVGHIPITLPLKETVRENVCLVGDSAHFANPLTAGGIANALIAGKFLGTVIGKTLLEGLPMRNLREYQSLWQKSFRRVLVRRYKVKGSLWGDDKKIEHLFLVARLLIPILKILPKGFIRRVARLGFAVDY